LSHREEILPASAPTWRIELLGSLRVWHGPQPVDLGPMKQRALFAVLALNAEECVSVDKLLDAGWGTPRPRGARQLVYTYIARLRQAFEPTAPRRQRDHVISSMPAGYQLNIGREHSDLGRFHQLVARAHEKLANGALAPAFQLLGEALRLWRDPTLAELEALLRSSDRIDSLRRSWADAAATYVGLGLRLGQPSAVLPAAHQIAAADPLNEAAQAKYLEVLGHTGQRAAAIEQFGLVCGRLRDELGVRPGAGLVRTYREAVLAGEEYPVERVQVAVTTAPVVPPWRGTGPPPGRLIHRDKDQDAIVAMLAEQRLVTVTGPPGSGKSALALHAAVRLRDAYIGGVAVVDCSDLIGADQLRRRLVSMFMGLEDLHEVLDDHQVLIVLDNAEHMVDGCALLAEELILNCRQVSLMVTSRESLGLSCEMLWPVRPLPVPEADQTAGIDGNPAVQLFVRRAAQVRPDFALTADNAAAAVEVCRQMDGLPLAIEMAATCLASDTVDGLVRRLADPLEQIRPLRRDRLAHHRSLRDTLQHSLDCLTECERWCFLRLGMLPRHFHLSDAREMWQSGPWHWSDVHAVLTRLADKSLLGVRHGLNEPSYRMLRLVHRFVQERFWLELNPAAGVSNDRAALPRSWAS